MHTHAGKKESCAVTAFSCRAVRECGRSRPSVAVGLVSVRVVAFTACRMQREGKIKGDCSIHGLA